MKSWRFLLCAVAFWLGYVVLLRVVPPWWPPDPSLPNVAAVLGYNTNVAFLAAALWTLAGIFGFAIAFEKGLFERAPAVLARPVTPARKGRLLELAAVFLVFALAYWPAFLARHGHYIEDNYFLAVLSRMQCGQLPYRDFEFLYGPLMIYPAHAWVEVFGFSMKSYYGFLALLEGAFFATLLAVLQRYLPDWRWRYLAFALLLPPLFDTLLGLNWIGWRRFVSIFVIMIVAARPKDLRAALAAGGIAGLHIAYSHDYGLIGLISALGIYAVLLLGPERQGAILSAACLCGAAVAVWLASSLALTGGTFPDYLSATLHILARAASTGLGSFRFHWTLHTLALFGLLGAAVVALGAGLFRLRREALGEGDRLLLGALIFAVITLKVGLQRADVWHMSGPFLGLMAAFLVAPPARVFVLGQAARRAVYVLIAVSAFANGVGILPTGSYYASGLLRGAIDVVTGVPPAGAIPSRRHSAESERTAPNADYVALAGYLAEPANAARPVLFYGNRWWLGYHVGVCSGGYAFYDLMYSDGRRPMRRTLERNPEALVIIGTDTYGRLFEGAAPADLDPPLSIAKRLSSWLSTVHYNQVPIERRIKEEIWRRNLGDRLTADYERVVQFGRVVVLSRRSAGDPGQGSPND